MQVDQDTPFMLLDLGLSLDLGALQDLRNLQTNLVSEPS